MISETRSLSAFALRLVVGLTLLCSPAWATDYVLENSDVKVVFTTHATYGFVPKSITRKVPSNYTFNFTPRDLWKVVTWSGTGTTQYTWAPIGTNGGTTSANLHNITNGQQLDMHWTNAKYSGVGLPPTDRITVNVTAILMNGDPGVELSSSVTMNTATQAVQSMICPQLSVTPLHGAGLRGNEHATLPVKQGSILDDPIANMLSPNAKFCPGGLSHQLFTYYDSSPAESRVLYLQTRDGAGTCKAFTWYSDGSVLRLDHRAYGNAPLTTNGGFTSSYDFEISAIAGDWFDACKRYRTWAKTQPYTAHGVIGSSANTTFSPGIRTVEMWDHVAVCQLNGCSGAGDPNCPAHGWPYATAALTNWHTKLGVDGLAVRAGNWSTLSSIYCQGPSEPDPGDPASGFAAASGLSRLQGSYFAPYTLPLGWDTHLASYASAQPYALVDENGAIPQGLPIGDHCALMCPGTSFWQQALANKYNAARIACSVPGFYLDVWGGFPTGVCYASHTGHTAGVPTSFASGQITEMTALRNLARSDDPDFYLQTENVNELSMRVTELQGGQLYDGGYNPKVHPVPMFNAIYKPYVYVFYFTGYNLEVAPATCDNTREANSFYQAMNYAYGNMLHVTEDGIDADAPLVGDNPSSQPDFPFLDFMGKLARSYRQVRKYMLEGEQERLRGVQVSTEFPCACVDCGCAGVGGDCTRVAWPIQDQQPVVFGCLRHSLADDQWAVVLVNWKPTSQSITFQVPPTDVGGTASDTVKLVPICMDNGLICDPNSTIPLSAPNYQATISVPGRNVLAYRVQLN